MNTIKKSNWAIAICVLAIVGLVINTFKLTGGLQSRERDLAEYKEKEANLMMGLELKDELIDKYELKNILACEEQTKEVMRLKFYTEKARDLSTELCGKVKDMPEFLKNPQKWYKVTIDSTNNVHVDRIPYETTTGSVVKEGDDIPTEQGIEEPIAQEESDAPSYTVPE